MLGLIGLSGWSTHDERRRRWSARWGRSEVGHDAPDADTDTPSTTDVEYQLTDDFDATTTTLIGTGDLVDQLWATGVAAWTVVPQLVSFQLTLEAGDLTDTSINAVSLRD